MPATLKAFGGISTLFLLHRFSLFYYFVSQRKKKEVLWHLNQAKANIRRKY